MGLSKIFQKIIGKKEKKDFTPPDVTFLEDDISGVTHTIPIKIQPPLQEYIIKHNDEYLVFKSLDDMPAELREEIESIDNSKTFAHSYSVIIDGEQQSYNSYDEMPNEIRSAITVK